MVPISYDDEAGLVAALPGQDVLVITLSVTAAPGTHDKQVRAAAAAGVRFVMPNNYGNGLAGEKLHADMGYGHVLPQTALVSELGMQVIVLSCGFWYEWSLGCGEPCYGIDLVHRTAVLYDDGEVKILTSTWAQCGRAVAAALSLNVLPADEKDAATGPPTLSRFFDGLFVSSFFVSQRDMLASAQRVTGTTDADWTVTTENSRDRWTRGRQDMMKGDRAGFARAMYARIFWPSRDGQYETQNDLLGLPKEDLDAATREALRMVENHELPTL